MRWFRRNLYAFPTSGPGVMPRISMICAPSRSGRMALISSCAASSSMRHSSSS